MPSRAPLDHRDVAGLVSEVSDLRVAMQLVATRLDEVARELRDRAGRERQRYVSVARAAELLGVTSKTIRSRLRRGDLLGTKADGQQARWLVDTTSVERALGA
ncbi:MAG: hypothetical protein AB7N76_35870 [Planctomycetota bacterium]